MKKSELRELYQMMFPEYPDIVTVKELREMLGISRKLAYKLIDYGYIHAVKIGKSWLMLWPGFGVPKKSQDFLGRGGTAERVSFAACGETKDTELVTTRRREIPFGGCLHCNAMCSI